ncbi:MAG: response regulator [Dehalococcoidales bacterium]|nr:response regulator [Dehalococcoidales bacterium]
MTTENTILVVDDEQNMCMILRRILEKAEYKVMVASDGEKAIEIVNESKPDVILLDLMMPGMNGREVCQIVRKISPDTKIIYFSAKVESDLDKLKELRSEADIFISKPATSKKILSSVSNLLAN